MTQVSVIPKGHTFVRSLIIRAQGAAGEEATHGIATDRWGQYQADRITKAAVSAITTGDLGNEAATEFFDLVRERSLIGRLVGLRRVEFYRRMLSVTSGASGYWVSQAKPKPLSKPAIAGSTLDPLKVAAIICATNESLQVGGKITETGLQRDMERALIDTLDQALLDTANAGIPDEQPPAITYGAPAVAATSDPVADITALLAIFGGDMAGAIMVTDSQTATNMALLRNAGGALVFPDVGARGGSVLGIPLLISRGSPIDTNGGQLALIDPTGIAYGADGIVIRKAQHSSLAMSDDPDDLEDPGEVVSLWQTNTTAFLAEVSINWETQRAGSVAVLTGAGWGA